MLVDGLCRKTMSGWLGAGLAVALIVGAHGAASAQAAGAAVVQSGKTRVHGVVTDPDGALIPGATVTLTGNGPAVKATSGSDGSYSAAVTPGTYTVTFTMPGFATYTATDIAIGAANGMTLNAKMQIGVQSQVITVSSDSVQLSVDPDSNASAVVLTGKDLDALSDDPDKLSDELTALAGPAAGAGRRRGGAPAPVRAVARMSGLRIALIASARFAISEPFAGGLRARIK